MKSKKQPALACPFDNIGASACPVVVFSGFGCISNDMMLFTLRAVALTEKKDKILSAHNQIDTGNLLSNV